MIKPTPLERAGFSNHNKTALKIKAEELVNCQKSALLIRAKGLISKTPPKKEFFWFWYLLDTTLNTRAMLILKNLPYFASVFILIPFFAQ